MKLSAAITILLAAASVDAFSRPSTTTRYGTKLSVASIAAPSPTALGNTAATQAEAFQRSLLSAQLANNNPAGSTALTKQQKRLQQIKAEGGPLAFNTKFGALNPFAIYYGLVSIGLGLVWFAALTACQLLYKLTGNRVDKRRRMPVFLSHVWGTLLMAFTGCIPKVEGRQITKDFHKR